MEMYEFQDNVRERECRDSLFDCFKCVRTTNPPRTSEKENVLDEVKWFIEACKDKWKLLVVGIMNGRVEDREVEGYR